MDKRTPFEARLDAFKQRWGPFLADYEELEREVGEMMGLAAGGVFGGEDEIRASTEGRSPSCR